MVLLPFKWKILFLLKNSDKMLPIKDFFNLVLEFGDEWVVTNVDIDHKLEEIYIPQLPIGLLLSVC